MAVNEINLYELSGEGIRMTYSTSSIAGLPQFVVQRNGKDSLLTGGNIKSERSALGQLVTVIIESVPDLHTVTLTLALPEINADGTDVQLQTFAVLTTEKTSIAGPSSVTGALMTYEVVLLQGTGKHVSF
ncbi:MAG: hypothetical protein M3Y56_05530 [Armatimonadota bacterium]|nr:hypothetical protein [Armatimonadota bacterium]